MRDLIPILVLSIPVVAIVMNGMIKLQKMKLEESRLREQSAPEIDDVRNEVHQLRQELSEVQERLDFTERLLAAQKERSRLGPAQE